MSKRATISRLLAATIFSAGLMPPAAAHKQTEAAPANAPGATAAIEDIVVTARRRDESAQRVPVAINSLSAAMLTEQNVRSAADLTALTSGLRVVTTGGGSNADISLRGLSRAPGGYGPPAVLVYVGDVPLPPNASILPTFDLADVQVLKGPQGTLFGRNTIGGAILVNPQAPSYSVKGYATVGIGNYAYRLLEGALDIPLIADKAALRAAGQLRRRDGYIRNSGPGGDLNDIHQDAVRVSLLIEPTERLRNLAIFDYARTDEAGSAAVLVDLPADVAGNRPSGLAGLPLPFFHCGVAPACDIPLAFAQQQARGIYATQTSVAPRNYLKSYGVSNRTDLDVGAVRLRNIFGYRKLIARNVLDSDGLPITIPILTGEQQLDQRQITEELQMLGTGFDNRLDWIVGSFFLDYRPDNASHFSVVSPEAATDYALAFSKIRNYALFGQVGYKLVDNLKLNAGFRQSWDRNRTCAATAPGTTARPTGLSEACGMTAANFVRTRSSTPTWTLGIDYQATRNMFVYLTSRRGYREGGPNSPVFASITGAELLVPYQAAKPEKLTDIEAGIKSNWSIGSIEGRFNLSAYKIWYHDVQYSDNVTGVVAPTVPVSGVSITVNAGNQRISGLDAELIVRPFRDLTLSARASHVRLDRSTLQDPLRAGVAAEIPFATPRWTVGAGARYVLPIRPAGSPLVLNADYYHTDPVQFPGDTLPGYDLANMRFEWQDVAGTGLTAQIFVDNLFKERYYSASGVYVRALGVITRQIGAPRTYGAQLNYRF